ncbi:hypothetical protein MASR1M8_09970 [Thermomonas brevis]
MGAPVLPPMTSQRPYLLRAIYEWIADNGMTPHVLVDASLPGVRVPAHAVKDGRIVLNIAERAVGRLQMGNDALTFSARFAGVSQNVVVPVYAVLAVYSRETGQGMAMPDEDLPELDANDAAPDPVDTQLLELVETDADAPPPGDDDPDTPRPPRRGGHLRVVK